MSLNKTQQPLCYYNPQTHKLEAEQIYGNQSLRWLYQTKFGRWCAARILSHAWVSLIVGWTQSCGLSRFKIKGFVKKFEVQMHEFEERSYASFNDFFSRPFKKGARSFPAASGEIGAFAEGRALVLDPSTSFEIKNHVLNIDQLLKDPKSQVFQGGAVVIIRLCPTDYHRFHFPLAGVVESTWKIAGKYHSVHPFALEVKKDILVTNERFVTWCKSDLNIPFAMVEIGALCVGRIVQKQKSFPFHFQKGEEKGHFLFGASCVVGVFPKGAVEWDPELLKRSSQGVETFVKLGESLGRLITS